MPREGSWQRMKRTAGRDRSESSACDPHRFEQAARADGHVRIAGLDEAGRGPLAGPVVAAAVILPEGLLIRGVADSKQLTERQRELLFPVIISAAAAYGIGIADERTIETLNIREASLLAMERAVQAIAPLPDYLLVDGNTPLPGLSLPQRTIIKGDCLSHTIAAASIIAKVTRDRMMIELHEQYPQYNFRKHKGYGTAEHLALLRQYGPCDAHRRTFEPIASMPRVPA